MQCGAQALPLHGYGKEVMRAHEPETAVEDGSFDGSGLRESRTQGMLIRCRMESWGPIAMGTAQKSRAGPMPPPIMSVVSVPTGVVATPPIGAARIQRPAP